MKLMEALLRGITLYAYSLTEIFTINPNGLILNQSKCELFSPSTDTFPFCDSNIPTSCNYT